MSKGILTLTMNPAIDRTIAVDRLMFEDRAYILSRNDAAGGRGINAARVLSSFGANATAITTSGRQVRKFEELLRQDSFGKHIVKIRRNVRTNLTITDRQGLSLKLNEAGPGITPAEQNRILKAVEQSLPSSSWLMLCGSLPPDVDSHFYTNLVRLAAKHEVKTLLDTDGDALLHGIEGKPTVVKPNQSEAERLLNRVLLTRAHSIEAVQKIKGMGAEFAVLSLGGRGAVGASREGVLEAVPPQVEASSSIGAGDAMAAVLVWAFARGDAFGESLRWGVAAGTASSKLPGLQLASFEQTKEIYPQTQVHRIL